MHDCVTTSQPSQPCPVVPVGGKTSTGSVLLQRMRMGNWFSTEKPRPPVVLVPPLFHRPELHARSRMIKSSYDILFSKLAREHLFSDYYREKEQFVVTAMLKPLEDPNVDITVTVSSNEALYILGESPYLRGLLYFDGRRQDTTNPYSFVEIEMETYTNALRCHGCVFSLQTGLGAFYSLPVTHGSRLTSNGKCALGVRYGTPSLSLGTVIDPMSRDIENLWLVCRLGKIIAGCQYKLQDIEGFGPQGHSWMRQQLAALKSTTNWSCGVGYGESGRDSPLHPSFHFSLELKNNSKCIVSYYHHLVVQRKVKNPFEGEEVIAITNYIDAGLEFEQSIVDDKPREMQNKQGNLRIGGSWQINKNWLFKAKVGMLESSIALMFKTWWQPSIMLSLAASRDHLQRHTKLGFGLHMENFGGASYERAHPNYVMITPNKKHIAEEVLKNMEQPLLQTNISGMNHRNVELQRLNSIL